MTNETPDDDPLADEQAAAAAAEAAAIGGPGAEIDADPEMQPVYEAGGGEAEGFEQAEDDLIRNATHDDATGEPLTDAFPEEVESDRSGAEYGEADAIQPADS